MTTGSREPWWPCFAWIAIAAIAWAIAWTEVETSMACPDPSAHTGLTP